MEGGLRLVESTFTECEACSGRLTPAHMTKEVTIPRSPQHIAVVLQCSGCGHKNKVVMSREDWKASKVEHEEAKNEFKQIILDARRELEEAENILWMYEVWSKHPPLNEDKGSQCGCPTCKARWFRNA